MITSNSNIRPKSILMHHSSVRVGRSPHRRVQFGQLDWSEEEKKAVRGHVVRKYQMKRMLLDRSIRFQEHLDRKRAFDVFSSTNDAVRANLQDLLEGDSRTPEQYYTWCLYAMLQTLGAPPAWPLMSQLEWFRHSGLQYSKQFCHDYELCASYLLFLGRAEPFQIRFGENALYNAMGWTNPFLIVPTTNVGAVTSISCRSGVPVLSSSDGTLPSGSHYSPLEDEEYCSQTHFDSSPPVAPKRQHKHHKRNPKRFLQRALCYLKRTLLLRRRRHRTTSSSSRDTMGSTTRESRGVGLVDLGWVDHRSHYQDTTINNVTNRTTWNPSNDEDISMNDPWNAGWITGSIPSVAFPPVLVGLYS
jgi:hypothetical protein